MFDGSRRLFVGEVGLLAGGSLISRELGNWHAAAWRAVGQESLRAVDAGSVRVSRGPWTTLPKMTAGVHLESLRLEMPDGVGLHAFLYMPAAMSGSTKIPGLLGVRPYRNAPIADNYLAHRGYATLAVDVRGTGGSEGTPIDEYSAQEHEDSAHVIDWLSEQPWCNGNIGMYGGSYSAINTVWVASNVRPPALKAIFVLNGNDVRYTDDIHFPGGAMLMVDNSWAIGMVAPNSMPRAPDYPLYSQESMDRWDTAPWLQGFLHHQKYGPYWEHGSLAPHYDRLTTPTFLGGGYLDIYQNFVPRIMRNSPAVSRGVLGPWHHNGGPGPLMDWDAMRLKWFDRWLKGIDNGIDREPRASFYMPRWQPQSFRYRGIVPGEWRHLDDWPDTAFEPGARFYLRPDPEVPLAEISEAALAGDTAIGRGGQLAQTSGEASAVALRYHPATGGWGQSFGPTRGEGYYGLDHRGEDAYGLAFDTPPLHETVEILGFTKARLFVASTAPVATWIVRLNDVAPDGTSYLVSRGYLNGTHHSSHSDPEPLVAGEIYELEVELWCVGHTFEPGHRIRVVVTNADFPVIWPSPGLMTTTLFTGGDRPSHVDLPVLGQHQYGTAELRLLPEDDPRITAAEWDNVQKYQRIHDVATGDHTAYFELGNYRQGVDRIWCRVNENDPAVASVEFKGTYTGTDGDRRIDARADGKLSSDADSFTLDIECTLLANDEVVRTRRWQDTVKREQV